jgi:AraC family transcriptional regulator
VGIPDGPAQAGITTLVSTVGVEQVLGAGSIAQITAFSHHPGPIVDPEEEAFPTPVVVLTTTGCWRYRDRNGSIEVDDRVTLLGRAAQPYRCDHDPGATPDRSISVEFTGDIGWLEPQLLENPALARRSHVPTTATIRDLMTRLQQTARRSDPAQALFVDGFAIALLGAIMQAAEERPEPDRGPSRAATQAALGARDLLDTRLDQPVSLADLAAAVQISAYHLHRTFRQVVGCTPHQYHSRARLRRASELLTGSDLTVTSVARQVGYQSPARFSRAFREHTGYTPSEYRALDMN